MLGGAFGCGPIAVAPQPPLEVADAIVVLGNRPPVDRDGNVQPETRRRVATGVGLWFRGLAPVIVMTGGPAPFGVVEADVMRDAAVRLGVPPERVLTERASTDTIGNARGTVSMLCRQGLQRAGACRPSVIIVSSPTTWAGPGRCLNARGLACSWQRLRHRRSVTITSALPGTSA